MQYATFFPFQPRLTPRVGRITSKGRDVEPLTALQTTDYGMNTILPVSSLSGTRSSENVLLLTRPLALL